MVAHQNICRFPRWPDFTSFVCVCVFVCLPACVCSLIRTEIYRPYDIGYSTFSFGSLQHSRNMCYTQINPLSVAICLSTFFCDVEIKKYISVIWTKMADELKLFLLQFHNQWMTMRLSLLAKKHFDIGQCCWNTEKK